MQNRAQCRLAREEAIQEARGALCSRPPGGLALAPVDQRRRVCSFNYLLEARLAHPLAYDSELGAWISAYLDGIATQTRT